MKMAELFYKIEFDKNEITNKLKYLKKRNYSVIYFITEILDVFKVVVDK